MAWHGRRCAQAGEHPVYQSSSFSKKLNIKYIRCSPWAPGKSPIQVWPLLVRNNFPLFNNA